MISNPLNQSLDTTSFTFRDPSIRESIETLLAVGGYVLEAAGTPSTSGTTPGPVRRVVADPLDNRRIQNVN